MLLEFTCSNHHSIRKPVTLNMLAGTDDTMLEKTIEYDKTNVLRSAVIYGANGSGKTNVIGAISFVKNMVLMSITHQPGALIAQIPHKLDGYDTDSSYSMQFVIDDIRFAYGFTLKNQLVIEEYLYYFPNKRKTKIFERVGEDFQAGYNFKGKFNACKDVLKPNRLLLSCAANFSSVEEIEKVFRFFDRSIVIFDEGSQENWMDYSLTKIHDDPEIKKKALEFLNAFGIPVKDIVVKIEEKSFNDTNIVVPPVFAENIKQQIMQSKMKVKSAKVVYDKFFVDMTEESSGVKKVFSFLIPFLDIIENNRVLICDELEKSLHETILHQLIELVSEQTESRSQLIFTTHDTSILGFDLFRRDQIWFTEMNVEDRSTDLYSLTEINGVRKDDNFGKAYIAGRYGALPILNADFVKSVNREG